MERPSQAGVAGGCEIITGGGLVSGRLKAPWWAKGLMLEVRKIVRKLLVGAGRQVNLLLTGQVVRGRLVVEVVRLPELVRVGHGSVRVGREDGLLVHSAGRHYLG